MKEQLVLALSELQLEKNGEATLDDVTQEWADSILEGYKPTITSDASISGKKITMSKSGEVVKYIIDEELNIIETEETTGVKLIYEVKSRDGENLQVLVTVTDNENGLEKIEYEDGHIQDANGLKSASRDCTIQLGVEYRIKIISKNGEEKTETILINDYYHTITKNLGEGISIDNTAIKAAYNQPYQATIKTDNGYMISTLAVTMGGKELIVDKTTGIINIEKVTGDIEITATAVKNELNITDGLISYWPLQSNLVNIIQNDTIGNIVVSSEKNQADFSGGAYKMTSELYLKAENESIISSPKTMACQFKMDLIPEDKSSIIFGANNRYSDYCYGIFLKNIESGNRTYNGRYGYGDAINYAGNYIGEWINAVFTQDANGNSILYFNGEIVSTGTGGADKSIELILGYNAEGLLKNFAIYNKVLTQEEATNLFAD